MTNLASSNSSTRCLESYIRSALELGELTPATEAQISCLIRTQKLSDRDRTLLNILQDAIQDGCIRQR